MNSPGNQPVSTWIGEFILLAALWGASFLFMRLGASDVGPLPTAGLRVALATVFLWPIMLRQGHWPALRQHWRVIGIAGYAIDIQELESERGAHRRFVDTQRELLDRLSAAVAQFGPDQGLSFANLPFRRLFAIESDDVAEARPFARLLDAWREGGRASADAATAAARQPPVGARPNKRRGAGPHRLSRG